MWIVEREGCGGVWDSGERDVGKGEGVCGQWRARWCG